MQTKRSPPLVLKSLYPDSLISRPSFFLFPNEKGNTIKKTNSELTKAELTSSQIQCSVSLTSYTSRIPRVSILPCLSLVATCPCCCIWTCKLFPNGRPLPRIPTILTSPLNHGAITFMFNNTPLQLHQMVSLTQKVTPSFCSGPLSFMLGLIWGSKGNLAL